MQHEKNLTQLQKKIGYKFKDINLLKQALTHKSYSSVNYERLEFVGDSILNYTIAKLLYNLYPNLAEGGLSQLRANLVNQNFLVSLAEELDIGTYLFLGPGEIKTQGNKRPSILADTMEAIFGAISFDSNILESENFIRNLYQKKVKKSFSVLDNKNSKNSLQEILQSHHLKLPIYNLVNKTEKNNENLFEIECVLEDLNFRCKARASSKKAAESDAAKRALNFVRSKLSETQQ